MSNRSIEKALERAIEQQFMATEAPEKPALDFYTLWMEAKRTRLQEEKDREIRETLRQIGIDVENAVTNADTTIYILQERVKRGYIDVPSAEALCNYITEKGPYQGWIYIKALQDVDFGHAIPELLPRTWTPEDYDLCLKRYENSLKSPIVTARWLQLFQNSTPVPDRASLYRMDFKLGLRFQNPKYTYVGEVPAYAYKLLRTMVSTSRFIYRPEFNRGSVFDEVYSTLTRNEKLPIILMTAYNYSLKDLLRAARIPINDLSIKAIHDKVKITLKNWNKYRVYRTLYVGKISLYRRIREQVWRRMPPLEYEKSVWNHLRDYYPDEILDIVRDYLKQVTNQNTLMDQLQYYEQDLLNKPLEDLNMDQLLANIVNRSPIRYVHELVQLPPSFLSDRNNRRLAEALDNWGLDLKQHNPRRTLATLMEQFYCNQQADLFYHCLDYKMLDKLFRMGYRNGQQLVEDYENNRLKTKDNLILELAQYLQKDLLPIYVVRLS